jgi:hypothetical protein
MPSLRLPRAAVLFGLALALAAGTCARTQNPNAAKYPPRGRRCSVHVYNAPFPGVKEWDDLGIARVECPLDMGRVQCLAQLRERACQMGGDLLYDVPKRGARPGEQAMVFVGHVAHTKFRLSADGGSTADDEGPDGSSEGIIDHSSPVEVLTTEPAPDGGRD